MKLEADTGNCHFVVIFFSLICQGPCKTKQKKKTVKPELALELIFICGPWAGRLFPVDAFIGLTQ